MGSSKQESETNTRTVTHDKATFQAGNLEVIATDEKVILQGVDANITGTTRLDGKTGIDVLGVKDTYDSHTKNSSHSASIGVFAGFNGDSYGIGVEGSAQFSRSKENTSNETWQNSQLNSGTLITNSGGTLTLDAANANANRWEADVKGLTITSRQDTEKYDSKQVSAGGSFSVTYGSGGGGSVNAGYSKANMDYAQVNQQSGIRVGSGGMNANVDGYTQLNGAIIESEAAAENNQFNTKTLDVSDIRNYSELKTESVSVSAGTSGFNPTSAAMSLLGNRSESDSSTTKSAVSANINLNVENGEIPTSLSRDTANANEKVGKQDLQEIREQQETARVIGEISDNAVKIAAHKELEAIEQANLELGKLKQQTNGQDLTAEQTKAIKDAQDKVDNVQKAYDQTYGIGSTTGQTIKAVTAALQGLANHSPEQAVVALASPLINQQIHEATKNADGTTNVAANLAAHAVLSAVEAEITGNNALAGAAAGVAAESTAMLLANQLYEKPLDQLTETEKQNIVFLSQLASGLASGIVGDSTADAVAGAETGKRAVENNALESGWDAANVAIGITSLGYNIKEENYGLAILDALGLAYDIIATLIPFVPAGASAGLEAYRAGNSVKQSIEIGSDVTKVVDAANQAAKDINNLTHNPATTGTKIHRATASNLNEISGKSPMLSSNANSYMAGSNKAAGKQPDISWSNTGGWADLTTQKQWSIHLKKYESSFGKTNIPIIYSPVKGVTNYTPLKSGAGIIINTPAAAYEYNKE